MCELKVCISVPFVMISAVWMYTGLMGKSKGMMMRVAAVLHALFTIDQQNTLTAELSAASVTAALNLVEVCNEHAKIFSGHSSASKPEVYMHRFTSNMSYCPAPDSHIS